MTRRTRDDIDRWFDHGLDVAGRTLYLGSSSRDGSEESGTDYDMAARAIKALHTLDLTDGAINVLMNNPGGSVYDGLAIYDAIAGCRNNVTITGYGHVMSMGAWILQAADDRALAPNAVVMIHYGSSSFAGHNQDLGRWAAEEARLNRLMEDVFLERIRAKWPKYPLARLRRKLLFDSFLTAAAAVELGLADRTLQ